MMNEPHFRKIGEGKYENQNGDIIEKTPEEEGFIFNDEYTEYYYILKTEIEIGEDYMRRGMFEKDYPQKLQNHEYYSWTDDAGTWEVQRNEDDLILNHYINGEYIGGTIIPDFYKKISHTGARVNPEPEKIEAVDLDWYLSLIRKELDSWDVEARKQGIHDWNKIKKMFFKELDEALNNPQASQYNIIERDDGGQDIYIPEGLSAEESVECFGENFFLMARDEYPIKGEEAIYEIVDNFLNA